MPVAVVLLLLVLATPLSELYLDLRWYQAVGYEQVFTTLLWTEVGLAVGFGVITAALFYANLRLALRLTAGLRPFQVPAPNGQGTVSADGLASRLILPVILLAGFVAGASARALATRWLLYWNGTSFGETDPVLGYDVGFYMFQLPLLEAMSSFLLTTLGFSLLATAGLHLLRGGVTPGARGLTAHRSSRAHLTGIGAAILLVLAFDAWLAIPELLFSNNGPVTGASYSDVQAKLPALWAELAAAVLAAVLLVVSATRKRLVLLFSGVGVYVAVQLIAVQLYPTIIDRFVVGPSEAQLEAPYIASNIEATRAAYGLDGVIERELRGESQLSYEDIENNRATIRNIRLWDHEQLLDTFAQIQEIRTYYEFVSVDNDRYVIDGELRQTMLSPRELNPASLTNQNWINEHFTFTHGFGLTLGPVNTATPEGLPELFLQDIPPVSAVSGIEVTRPEIYFGELTEPYVIVRTQNREFSYPVGNERVYTEYDGAAGVHLDSWLATTATSLALGSLKLMLSADVDEDCRVLLRRRVADRVRAVAPFLTLDPDPYMVVREDGRLAWVQDAYTTSDRYPYAEVTDIGRRRINYIRSSVKAVVDAYDGTVDLFINAPEDPVLATWQRVFPNLLRPMSEMPPDLQAHLRYPDLIFRVQTRMFATYHMNDPELLYQREDQWELPRVGRADTQSREMEPYYTIMRLPGEEEPEFIEMLPFTPSQKQNLAAWMVARSDGDRLGELIVYRFPKDRLVFGPQQIMNRIDQEEDISRQVSLWDQRGSNAILGTLLVIPIEESLLYVTPLYLKAEGGRIPELKRVIVVYENDIAMEPTLDEAVASLFRQTEQVAAAEPAEASTADAPDAPLVVSDAPPVAATAVEEGGETAPAATEALTLFRRALDVQRAGDWAGYGETLDELQRVLEAQADEAASRSVAERAPAPTDAP